MSRGPKPRNIAPKPVGSEPVVLKRTNVNDLPVAQGQGDALLRRADTVNYILEGGRAYQDKKSLQAAEQGLPMTILNDNPVGSQRQNLRLPIDVAALTNSSPVVPKGQIPFYPTFDPGLQRGAFNGADAVTSRTVDKQQLRTLPETEYYFPASGVPTTLSQAARKGFMVSAIGEGGTVPLPTGTTDAEARAIRGSLEQAGIDTSKIRLTPNGIEIPGTRPGGIEIGYNRADDPKNQTVQIANDGSTRLVPLDRSTFDQQYAIGRSGKRQSKYTNERDGGGSNEDVSEDKPVYFARDNYDSSSSNPFDYGSEPGGFQQSSNFSKAFNKVPGQQAEISTASGNRYPINPGEGPVVIPSERIADPRYGMVNKQGEFKRSQRVAPYTQVGGMYEDSVANLGAIGTPGRGQLTGDNTGQLTLLDIGANYSAAPMPPNRMAVQLDKLANPIKPIAEGFTNLGATTSRRDGDTVEQIMSDVNQDPVGNGVGYVEGYSGRKGGDPANREFDQQESVNVFDDIKLAGQMSRGGALTSGRDSGTYEDAEARSRLIDIDGANKLIAQMSPTFMVGDRKVVDPNSNQAIFGSVQARQAYNDINRARVQGFAGPDSTVPGKGYNSIGEDNPYQPAPYPSPRAEFADIDARTGRAVRTAPFPPQLSLLQQNLNREAANPAKIRTRGPASEGFGQRVNESEVLLPDGQGGLRGVGQYAPSETSRQVIDTMPTTKQSLEQLSVKYPRLEQLLQDGEAFAATGLPDALKPQNLNYSNIKKDLASQGVKIALSPQSTDLDGSQVRAEIDDLYLPSQVLNDYDKLSPHSMQTTTDTGTNRLGERYMPTAGDPNIVESRKTLYNPETGQDQSFDQGIMVGTSAAQQVRNLKVASDQQKQALHNLVERDYAEGKRYVDDYGRPLAANYNQIVGLDGETLHDRYVREDIANGDRPRRTVYDLLKEVHGPATESGRNFDFYTNADGTPSTNAVFGQFSPDTLVAGFSAAEMGQRSKYAKRALMEAYTAGMDKQMSGPAPFAISIKGPDGQVRTETMDMDVRDFMDLQRGMGQTMGRMENRAIPIRPQQDPAPYDQLEMFPTKPQPQSNLADPLAPLTKAMTATYKGQMSPDDFRGLTNDAIQEYSQNMADGGLVIRQTPSDSQQMPEPLPAAEQLAYGSPGIDRVRSVAPTGGGVMREFRGIQRLTRPRMKAASFIDENTLTMKPRRFENSEGYQGVPYNDMSYRDRLDPVSNDDLRTSIAGDMADRLFSSDAGDTAYKGSGSTSKASARVRVSPEEAAMERQADEEALRIMEQSAAARKAAGYEYRGRA